MKTVVSKSLAETLAAMYPHNIAYHQATIWQSLSGQVTMTVNNNKPIESALQLAKSEPEKQYVLFAGIDQLGKLFQKGPFIYFEPPAQIANKLKPKLVLQISGNQIIRIETNNSYKAGEIRKRKILHLNEPLATIEGHTVRIMPDHLKKIHKSLGVGQRNIPMVTFHQKAGYRQVALAAAVIALALVAN